MKVTSIHIYPIKSLGGISLASSELTPRGLKWDRRFMLVDEHYEFLTQRSHAKMAMFSVALDGKHIVVKYKSDSIIIDSDKTNDWLPKRVKVWSSKVKAKSMDSSIDQWFSERMGINCRLAYMPDESKRNVNPFIGLGETVSFADGYPYLIANKKSLKQLNDKLETPVAMSRFRANIIVDGTTPFEEDHWKKFSIGHQEFVMAKKCARCPVVNIDPKNATSTPFVLKALSTFRKQNNKVNFGMNVFWKSKGKEDNFIRVGDEVVVK